MQEGGRRLWPSEGCGKTPPGEEREESNDRGAVVLGVEVGKLKHFRAALMGPTRVPLKRLPLGLVEKLEKRLQT